MLSKILYALLLTVTLTGTWIFLAGNWQFSTLFLGLGCALFVTLVSLRWNVVDGEGHPFQLSFTLPFYWAWLAKEVVVSTFTITRIVWKPELEIHPGFTWLPLHQHTDLGRTIYANSVTMTPGTTCVNIQPRRVLVHALEHTSLEALATGSIDKRVLRLTGARYGRGAWRLLRRKLRR